MATPTFKLNSIPPASSKGRLEVIITKNKVIEPNLGRALPRLPKYEYYAFLVKQGDNLNFFDNQSGSQFRLEIPASLKPSSAPQFLYSQHLLMMARFKMDGKKAANVNYHEANEGATSPSLRKAIHDIIMRDLKSMGMANVEFLMGKKPINAKISKMIPIVETNLRKEGYELSQG